MGLELMTSAIPVRSSTNSAMKPCRARDGFNLYPLVKRVRVMYIIYTSISRQPVVATRLQTLCKSKVLLRRSGFRSEVDFGSDCFSHGLTCMPETGAHQTFAPSGFGHESHDRNVIYIGRHCYLFIRCVYWLYFVFLSLLCFSIFNLQPANWALLCSSTASCRFGGSENFSLGSEKCSGVLRKRTMSLICHDE